MTTFTATFNNGSTIRCDSSRAYTHAYRVTGTNAYGFPMECSAFSTSEERAARSARSSFGQLTRTADPKRGVLTGRVSHVEIVRTKEI
jgi:hypothetical protein